MNDLCNFDQIGSGDGEAVGGKALSLGLLTRAGLPVPPGFCVTSSAFRRLKSWSPQGDPALVAQVTEAYRWLGAGPVAVRSSATAEDGTAASFAGQQETILGVTGEEAVLEAVARCWASLDSERAVAYRRRQGVRDSELAMAVVVQRLVPAEVSGVLFTRDPLDPEGRRMLVEASWGLGESVVSGRITPDRYHLDRATGAVRERHVSNKPIETRFHPESGVLNSQEVPAERQNQPCLSDQRLVELAELGRRVEAFYGDARDVEWAWAEGRFWLLQARPITASGAAERELVRREEIAALAIKASPRGTVWSRFNLAEILPRPTPMTWSIVRRLLSGRGGYGLMFRDLGFDPAPEVDEIGVYDLVCGRPYCNLSREPLMYAQGLPLEHSFAALKANPHLAAYPRAQPNWSRVGWQFWLFLPITFFRYSWLLLRLVRLMRTSAPRLRQEILPAFASAIQAESDTDLSKLETPALIERLEDWIQRTLCDFARDSLKPTVLAAQALTNVEQLLQRSLGTERARAALGELTMGVRPDAEADLPGALMALASGRMDQQTFLKQFGHRGNQEMELAEPRWSEEPDRINPKSQIPNPRSETAFAFGIRDLGFGISAWQRIADEARLSRAQRASLVKELQHLHDYLALRETAKHYLMKGYALIRRLLVELDRRYRLGGGIFYLTVEDLARLVPGEDLSSLIAERRRRRSLALSLEVPPVLFSDDLDAIGRPTAISGLDTFQGVALSAGVAEGVALVLHEPTTAELPGEPYVLVCPSTDPAWVPLFVHALALVMETGGVLSHGAIVAREFGLPAVAGLAGIQQCLKSGQRLRVDGASGRVTILKP